MRCSRVNVRGLPFRPSWSTPVAKISPSRIASAIFGSGRGGGPATRPVRRSKILRDTGNGTRPHPASESPRTTGACTSVRTRRTPIRTVGRARRNRGRWDNRTPATRRRQFHRPRRCVERRAAARRRAATLAGNPELADDERKARQRQELHEVAALDVFVLRPVDRKILAPGRLFAAGRPSGGIEIVSWSGIGVAIRAPRERKDRRRRDRRAAR